jgi:isocitrate lyase
MSRSGLRPKRHEREWENDSRWNGIVRDYTADDGERLRGSIDIKYTDSTEAEQFHY